MYKLNFAPRGTAEAKNDKILGTYVCSFQLENNKVYKLRLKNFCIQKNNDANIFMNSIIPEENETFSIKVEKYQIKMEFYGKKFASLPWRIQSFIETNLKIKKTNKKYIKK